MRGWSWIGVGRKRLGGYGHPCSSDEREWAKSLVSHMSRWTMHTMNATIVRESLFLVNTKADDTLFFTTMTAGAFFVFMKRIRTTPGASPYQTCIYWTRRDKYNAGREYNRAEWCVSTKVTKDISIMTLPFCMLLFVQVNRLCLLKAY